MTNIIKIKIKKYIFNNKINKKILYFLNYYLKLKNDFCLLFNQFNIFIIKKIFLNGFL